MMMFAFMIPTCADSLERPMPITERELFERDRKQLSVFACPHCNETGGLYSEFVSIGCYNCFWHNGLDEVAEFNNLVMTE